MEYYALFKKKKEKEGLYTLNDVKLAITKVRTMWNGMQNMFLCKKEGKEESIEKNL